MRRPAFYRMSGQRAAQPLDKPFHFFRKRLVEHRIEGLVKTAGQPAFEAEVAARPGYML
jgi:hypothetical protein